MMKISDEVANYGYDYNDSSGVKKMMIIMIIGDDHNDSSDGDVWFNIFAYW